MPRPANARRIRKRITEREKTRGLLVAFEGPDGSGKTTQRKLLERWLEGQHRQVVATRWASSPLVKPMLKERRKIRTLSIEEYALLHAVDFRHRVETVILPALWSGKTVLADRYLFTALARDAARGLDLGWLLHAYSPLLWPDLVIHFSATEDPLASDERFIDRVVTEYDNVSVALPFVSIDAGQTVYRQHTRIRTLVENADKRPWMTFSEEAVQEWLTSSPAQGD